MSGLSFVHRFEPGPRPCLLLLLHGTGGNEDDLVPLAQRLAPGVPLLAPRGKVLENGAPRFFRRLAPGVFDEADLRVQAADLAAFVGAAQGHYGLEGLPVYAMGYSNGANMAAALLLLHPSLLEGALLLRPVLPLRPHPLPDLSGKAVYVAAGEKDPWAPRERVEALLESLERAGARVEAAWWPAGHALETPELAAARAWLARRLP
ncbi:putative hydrolase MhqD [Meiothermus luteus]|jgi:predicted esterase|uniref:Putative hydrolase MhqD n=1 Tax=Meiothermus luteus TaxID=2026184 RepID=A0A399ENZ0_9DEIN|nr:dienelactone hydrolase family protein [Meiothermus luteus]RIH84192.1 putative hydrolase MhqD [Meiothermus luteus]RMH55153.1 MAG: alpha/beta hydrolase [Deinococcota bacterium]